MVRSELLAHDVDVELVAGSPRREDRLLDARCWRVAGARFLEFREAVLKSFGNEVERNASLRCDISSIRKELRECSRFLAFDAEVESCLCLARGTSHTRLGLG